MAKNPAKSQKIAKFPKVSDLETHIQIVDIDGSRVVEFRDYITSLQEYKRGYWIPATADAVNETVLALQAIQKSGTLE